MEEIRIQDGSGDRKYFTIIPNYILNHSTLWDREVYIQMKKIAGESGTCWTSQKTLSDQCGMSVNRLKKSIKYLIDHEWIKFVGKKVVKTTGGIQEVNEYRIADLWRKNIDYYDKGVSRYDTPTTQGVSRNDIKGYHENAQGVSPESYKEEPLKKNPIKEDIPFDTFWSVYPKRQDKVKAKKKWDKIDFEIQKIIISHVIDRIDNDRQWIDGYIPMPTTFLNGERWEDEYEEVELSEHINLDLIK